MRSFRYLPTTRTVRPRTRPIGVADGRLPNILSFGSSVPGNDPSMRLTRGYAHAIGPGGLRKGESVMRWTIAVGTLACLCACAPGATESLQPSGFAASAVTTPVTQSPSFQCNSSFVADYAATSSGKVTPELAMKTYVSYGSIRGLSKDPSTYVRVAWPGPEVAFRSSHATLIASQFGDGTWYVGRGYICN